MKCCRNPDYRKAYVPCWPFKARYCVNCQEVELITGPILTFIWKYFVWPFWGGAVCVLAEDGDNVE